MPTVEETVEQVAQAETWDARVQAIRRVPELHGQLEHSAVYAALAERLYRPHLSPQFAFVPWRDDYELETFIGFYNRAVILTNGFRDVAPGDLIRVLREAPEVLVIFRTILGYTPGEFSAAVSEIAKEVGQEPVGQARIKAIEGGRPQARPWPGCAPSPSTGSWKARSGDRHPRSCVASSTSPTPKEAGPAWRGWRRRALPMCCCFTSVITGERSAHSSTRPARFEGRFSSSLLRSSSLMGLSLIFELQPTTRPKSLDDSASRFVQLRTSWCFGRPTRCRQ